MSQECVFPLQSKQDQSHSNCFVDTDGFLNATSHAVTFEHLNQTNLALCKVVFHDKSRKVVQFGTHPLLDYATSLQSLPDKHLPMHIPEYAPEPPAGELSIVVYSAYPQRKTIYTSGKVKVISVEGHGVLPRIQFHSDHLLPGDSGALATYMRPAVSGRYITHGSDEQALGAVILKADDPLFPPGIGYIEFSPNVLRIDI